MSYNIVIPPFNFDILQSIAENPIFIPKKHTIRSYRAEQRLAKKRKKNRKT